MAGNLSSGFVSLPNLISEIQYNIQDHETNKYYPLITQKVLNALRNVNVHYARLYKEVALELDSDLYSANYPSDTVKIISVGIYKNGEFWSFTRKPEMAKTTTGGNDGYDEDFYENEEIPDKGIRFGATGKNIAYWVEDDENCRLFVRNYTSNPKIIVRYRSNGFDCSMDNCIPYKAKDLIISMVTYEFGLMGIPRRMSGMELQLWQMERARHFDEYTDLEYIPQNMDEFMDAQFASYNVTVRR